MSKQIITLESFFLCDDQVLEAAKIAPVRAAELMDVIHAEIDDFYMDFRNDAEECINVYVKMLVDAADIATTGQTWDYPRFEDMKTVSVF